MRRAVWILGLVGCSWNYGDGKAPRDGAPLPHDATIVPDAPNPPPYCSPGCYPANTITVTCSGVTVTESQPQHAISPMYCCQQGPIVTTAICGSGCAVQGSLTFAVENAIAAPRADQFCAGATEAKVDDACGMTPCIPTRAVLAGDGTVASEAYLTCPFSTHRCTSTAAPVVANYLARCDLATVTQYGTANAHGIVTADTPDDANACLIAWDSAAQAARSGITVKCIGDWQCPQGSLCDDKIPVLSTSTRPVAVCKPGPRGTLAPAMLSP